MLDSSFHSLSVEENT